MRRLTPFVLLATSAATVVSLLLAGAANTVPPPPVATCSPGPADCYAWHTSNVTVSWSSPPANVSVVSGCKTVTVSSDTGGRPEACTWSDGGSSITVEIKVRRDATPPSVRGTPARGPDANGWYSKPLTVEFSGSDALSGVTGCSSATYSGPDSGTAGIQGTCSDGAGNTGSTTYQVKYDATAPTVAAKPNRKPNANGWYNRAVTVAFVGADAVSGIESCAAPVEYKGPDTEKTSVTGTCRDTAANTSQPVGFDIRLDTKPPSLARVRAEIRRQGVSLRWAASKDSVKFAVVRRPGLRGPKPSTIYAGRAASFVDGRVANGVKYRYTVTAYDPAGNGAAKVLLAHPNSVASTKGATVNRPQPAQTAPALARPAPGARVAAPPLLAWSPVASAAYYNVQLFRNGVKVLSVWPTSAKLQLQRTWRYGGRSYTLSPGRYRWYVWPGFGDLSANQYGKLLGTRTFLVVRR